MYRSSARLLLKRSVKQFPINCLRFCNTAPDTRDLLLDAALKNVSALGWSEDAIATAATEIGLPPLSHKIACRGPVEVVEFFMKKKRDHVQTIMQQQLENDEVLGTEALNGSVELVGEEEPKTTTKVHIKSAANIEEVIYKAVEIHIDYLAPYISSWPSALALLAEPQQVPYTMEILIDIVDDLCQFAKIKTSRLDWYGERVLLLSVLSTTELFMLTDKSEKFIETRLYLKRAVKNYTFARSSFSAPSIAAGMQFLMTSISRNLKK